MKKSEKVKQIIEELVRNRKFNQYSKEDIENAIIISRECLDERTVEKWFRFLWKLQYVIQPVRGVYSLNLPNLVNLELSLPADIDPKQQRFPL